MRLHKKIPFTEIDSIPELIKDFLCANLTGAEGLQFNVDNFRSRISEKTESYHSEIREVLCTVMEKQIGGRATSLSQQENLRLLRQKNTFTVTTGHQLNLFSGPVFFIYKILQTIKTAKYLKEHFADCDFVPVFWMATEDHDFEEINFFRTEDRSYHIRGDSGGAVGRISIGNISFIADFEEEFRDTVFGTELIVMLKEAYAKGNTLAQATRIFVNRMFSDYGLLVIDGDDPELKHLMIPAFNDELLNRSLHHHSKKQVEFLTEKYAKVQVNPREINLFYLSDTRNRIDFDGQNYIVVDTEFKFSSDQIIEELESHPQKFSPNALMRPVYQESVLPNVAYIGGNAEIMYWLELTGYFTNINLPMPILVPRDSMLFLKEKTLEKINRLELTVEDFFRDFSDVIKMKLLADSEILNLLNAKESEIATAFNELREMAKKTDITFGNLVSAEQTRQLKAYERMRKRLLRAEKIKQYELVETLQRLYLQIHPSKNWQERVYNFSVFYAGEGHAWLETCLEEMDVTQSELIVVVH